MNSKKDLIFIIPDLQVGGAQKVLVYLINFLATKKFNIKLIILDRFTRTFKLSSKIKIINLNLYKKSKNIFEKIYYNLKRIKKIRSELKKEKKATVISFLTTTNILSIIANIGLRRKLIVNERNDIVNQKISFIWKILRIVLYCLVFKIVKNIPNNKTENKFLFKRKTIFIPNPLISNAIIKNKFKREKIILTVARLNYQKNISLLIRSFAKSIAIKNNWKLIILGKGSEKNKLKSECYKLNIVKHVFFKGFIKNINYWYKKSAIFILSSRFEGMPNALIEAISFKLPVIGSNIPGIKFFIKNNNTGLLFDNNNENSLVKSINYYIKNENKRIQLSRNAYKKLIRVCNPNIFLNDWQKILNETN